MGFAQKDIIMNTIADNNFNQGDIKCFDDVTQVVDAAKFLRIFRTRKCDIEDVRYIPPILGSDNFGMYKITFCNEQSITSEP